MYVALTIMNHLADRGQETLRRLVCLGRRWLDRRRDRRAERLMQAAGARALERKAGIADEKSAAADSVRLVKN